MHKQFRVTNGDASSSGYVGPRAAKTVTKLYPIPKSLVRESKEKKKKKVDPDDDGEDWFEIQRKKARKARGLDTDDDSPSEDDAEEEEDEEAIERRKRESGIYGEAGSTEKEWSD